MISKIKFMQLRDAFLHFCGLMPIGWENWSTIRSLQSYGDCIHAWGLKEMILLDKLTSFLGEKTHMTLRFFL